MNNDKPDHIEQFFAWSHLPEHLQLVSKPFGDLAVEIVATLPRNPERTVALRKLLEAKDAAVRCKIAKEPTSGASTSGTVQASSGEPGARPRARSVALFRSGRGHE